MNTFKELFRSVENSPEYLAANIQMNVALLIEQIMAAQNLSKSDLASVMECSRAYVTSSLRGDTNFSILSLSKYALALNCDLKIELEQKALSQVTKKEYEKIFEISHNDFKNADFLGQIKSNNERKVSLSVVSGMNYFSENLNGLSGVDNEEIAAAA